VKILLATPEGNPRKSFFILNNENLNQQLQNFGEIEKFLIKTWTNEDILCEGPFEKHTKGNEMGRHIVKLLQRKGQIHLRGTI
jgi:hypothetical protein